MSRPVSQALPEAVQRYLNVSTCLLWPHAARQVRAELWGHLHQDMLDGVCAGHSEAQAWEQALEMAGPAWRTALALAHVHTLGLVVRALLLGGALGGASLALQSQSGHIEAGHVQSGQP